MWSLVLAVLHIARELRDSDDGDVELLGECLEPVRDLA